jgi:putative ABC transport system substrate-binding protein
MAARAQQPTKVCRVGYIFSITPVSQAVNDPWTKFFVDDLRTFGYVEGRNLILEFRSAEGRYERFTEIARELVSLNVDVIATSAFPMTRAVGVVTQTIPIVTISNMLVEEGLIQSLARPGGNITGLTTATGKENAKKKFQLLKEVFPAMANVACLINKMDAPAEWEQFALAKSREFGVKFWFAFHAPDNYADAFALIAGERPDALYVGTPTDDLLWSSPRPTGYLPSTRPDRSSPMVVSFPMALMKEISNAA